MARPELAGSVYGHHGAETTMMARGHKPCPDRGGGGGGAHLDASPALLEEEGWEGSAPRATKRSCPSSSMAMMTHHSSDGAAALVLVSEAKNLGLQVLARTRGYADAAQKIPYLIWMRTPTNKFSLSDVGAGVIDVDYCGLVGVVLFNHSETDFIVKPGNRVAQMIVQVITTPEVAEVEDLDATVRREGVLGSTNV
ncbi:Deoxyuridine 5'-triphosphate nucleotidohydrolase [Triticum urartu]|uniref:dUTP diphosphatase n=1 Tax=Triticum urartu TaxID=4572 RepID=M7ZGK0_TRIUA|nr:Deoxyuridine 5'-triphosphate nucleotidohydrolase [Triticum urartu]